MNKLIINSSCVFALCAMPIAFAGEDGKRAQKEKQAEAGIVVTAVEVKEAGSGEQKKKQSDAKVGIAVIDVKETGKKRRRKGAAKTQRVTIEINGEKKEIELSEDPQKSLEKIQKIIVAADTENGIHAAIIGNGMIVGPNGEKKIFKFGSSEENENILRELPDEVGKRLEKVMEDASKRAAFGKILMIGPDGVEKSLEVDAAHPQSITVLNLQKEAQEFIEQAINGTDAFSQMPKLGKLGMGRAIIMLPDGTRQVIPFESGMEIETTPEFLGKLPLLFQSKNQEATRKSRSNGKSSNDSVSDKLDLILKRLDQIEKRVQSLESL